MPSGDSAGAAGWDVYTHGGRKRTRARRGRVGAKNGGARRRRNPADQHGPRRHPDGFDLDVDARRCRRGVPCRSSPRAASARLPICRKASVSAAPMRCWPRASSTTASSRCARRRRCSRATASPCGREAARRCEAQKAPARTPPVSPREVRVIGGAWKRSKLPVADRPGLRPTPDRVRETLFNWLGQALDGWRCVDAFAGSGALGFEAASRGAAEVVLVERDPALVASLQATRERLHADTVRVERADALQWMARATAAQRRPRLARSAVRCCAARAGTRRGRANRSRLRLRLRRGAGANGRGRRFRPRPRPVARGPRRLGALPASAQGDAGLRPRLHWAASGPSGHSAPASAPSAWRSTE